MSAIQRKEKKRKEKTNSEHRIKHDEDVICLQLYD